MNYEIEQTVRSRIWREILAIKYSGRTFKNEMPLSSLYSKSRSAALHPKSWSSIVPKICVLDLKLEYAASDNCLE